MSNVNPASIWERINSVPFWYHRIEFAPGIVTPGINASSDVLRRLNLPRDCKGLRALDIGARDGFFSFELERRGAEVVAIDQVAPDKTGFSVAKSLLGSKVEYQVRNVYDLNPAQLGRFDIVLFLGVLYHLRNPLLALDSIWSVSGSAMWLESHVMDEATLVGESEFQPLKTVAPNLANVPIMQFFPNDELNKDSSNWWAPNCACVEAMLESCNFRVDSTTKYGNRAIFRCHVQNDREREYLRQIERSVVP